MCLWIKKHDVEQPCVVLLANYFGSGKMARELKPIDLENLVFNLSFNVL
jgi:hypothetical protein